MTAISKLRFALLAMIVAFLMSVAGIAQAGQVDGAPAGGADTGAPDTAQWDDDDDDDEWDDDDDDDDDGW